MLDIAAVRKQFPGLNRDAIFFDGPGGSQTPRCVVDAVSDYFLSTNSNSGGVFALSRESDELLARGHQAMADFLGADDPGTIIFGANMTTLTFAVSRAIARTWKSGDEVIVTKLDHDGNVAPWLLAARDAGAVVKFVPVKTEDCTLDLEALKELLSPRTKLVAVGCASNATGTVNPVKEIIRWAHAVGALVYLDAVHHAPHLPIDVKDWDVDFLACSPYKFFGPHAGVLYGKRELLEKFEAYKVRPCKGTLPDKWMTGTQNHEAIAGTLATVEYFEALGRIAKPQASSRREAVVAAYEAIGSHERELIKQFLRGVRELNGLKLYGIDDPNRLNERCATFSIRHERLSPRELSIELDRRNIYSWAGTFYAVGLTESLGVDAMLRVGMLHYNTSNEVERVLSALAEL